MWAITSNCTVHLLETLHGQFGDTTDYFQKYSLQYKDPQPVLGLLIPLRDGFGKTLIYGNILITGLAPFLIFLLLFFTLIKEHKRNIFNSWGSFHFLKNKCIIRKIIDIRILNNQHPFLCLILDWWCLNADLFPPCFLLYLVKSERLGGPIPKWFLMYVSPLYDCMRPFPQYLWTTW